MLPDRGQYYRLQCSWELAFGADRIFRGFKNIAHWNAGITTVPGRVDAMCTLLPFLSEEVG